MADRVAGSSTASRSAEILRRLIFAGSLAAAGCLAATFPVAAQSVPGEIETKHREVLTHGSECILTSVITILQKNVLYALKTRKCGANTRKPSLDEGWEFPLNRKTTTHFTCSIKPGLSPYKICTDGERRKLTGMRFNEPIRLETDRTMESRVSSRGVFIKLDFDEMQYIGDAGQTTKKVRQIWQFDVQISGGRCKLADVAKTLTEDGKNRSPIAISPVACRILK